MTDALAHILELASELSLKQREELIDRLVETVETSASAASSASAGSTWTPELERRAREALRGENLVGEASEVIARAREELHAEREARRVGDEPRRASR